LTEPDGFRAFVVSRQASLLRTAWLLTGDWQAAEDLVQVALAKVWPHWNRVLRDGDPESYVRRTVVTTFLTARRRRWHGERPGPLPDSPAEGDPQEAVDLRDGLRRVLPLLGPRQRAVVVLRFAEDLSETQVAAELGCSVGTVKSQTSKALATLRAALHAMPELGGMR